MSCGFFPPASATTDPSLTGDKAAGGGESPQYETDPSLTGDNAGGRLPETVRRGVEGVVIENKRKINKVGVFVLLHSLLGLLLLAVAAAVFLLSCSCCCQHASPMHFSLTPAAL
jgi:hypothetical protein